MEERHTLFIIFSDFLALFRRHWDVQVSSSISSNDAAEIGKYACVSLRKYSIINLDRSCVSNIQCHNFVLLAADVEANFLRKSVKALRLLLNVPVGV